MARRRPSRDRSFRSRRPRGQCPSPLGGWAGAAVALVAIYLPSFLYLLVCSVLDGLANDGVQGALSARTPPSSGSWPLPLYADLDRGDGVSRRRGHRGRGLALLGSAGSPIAVVLSRPSRVSSFAMRVVRDLVQRRSHGRGPGALEDPGIGCGSRRRPRWRSCPRRPQRPCPTSRRQRTSSAPARRRPPSPPRSKRSGSGFACLTWLASTIVGSDGRPSAATDVATCASRLDVVIVHGIRASRSPRRGA